MQASVADRIVDRWGDTGHETTFFRGPDATGQHFEHDPAPDPR